jgi:hypothetical protein
VGRPRPRFWRFQQSVEFRIPSTAVERGKLAGTMTSRILTIIMALTVLTPPAPADRHFGRVLLMGSYILVFDDMRVLFNAGMTAGDFFGQLERRRTAEGERFFRNSRQVIFYPESLKVDVFGSPSTLGETPMDKRHPGTAAALMDSLQIKPEWKTGLSTRPVSRMTVRRLERSEMGPMVLWGYELAISCEGVPLTDHLIVNVYAPDSSLVARFSAAP